MRPVLFLTYINELSHEVEPCSKLFADDTKLYAGIIPTHHSTLQALNKLIEWTQCWEIQFNTDKCKAIHIGHNNNKIPYNMNHNRLTAVADEKDLGVHFDNTLKFSVHCAKAAALGCSKGELRVGVIKRTFSNLSQVTFSKVYKSIMRPHLEYGSCI